jgi:hypothetical protein
VCLIDGGIGRQVIRRVGEWLALLDTKGMAGLFLSPQRFSHKMPCKVSRVVAQKGGTQPLAYQSDIL